MFGLFLATDQRSELAILGIVGWRRSARTLLLICQAALLGLVAAGLAVLTTAIVSRAMGGIALSPTLIAEIVVVVLTAHLAIAAHPDRQVGSAALDEAQSYVEGELRAQGSRVEQIPFLSRTLRLFGEDGAPIDLEAQLTSLFPVALAYDPSLLSQPSVAFTQIAYVDAVEGQIPSVDCVSGAVFIRVGRTLTEYAHADFGMRLLMRCPGSTQAVFVVTAPDRDWQSARAIIRSIEIPVAHHVIGEPISGLSNNTPWIVAPLDSSGPGATQSAAPSAVAVQIARLAKARGVAIRFAFVINSEGSAAFDFRTRGYTENARWTDAGPRVTRRTAAYRPRRKRDTCVR
jgi:hypothetical protein